jgi:hypothetical protein
MKLPEIIKAETICVEDGDVLVVYVKPSVPLAVRERTKKDIANLFLPKIVKVIVCNADLVVDIKVIRAE